MPYLRIASAVILAVPGHALAQGPAPTLTRVLTIGCESCGDATQFGTIWDVSVSARGEILVADKEPPMLRRFDASGRRLWATGQRGKGPGEYVMPFRAAQTDSGIAVVDMTNARITDLSLSGQLVGSTPLLGFATTAGVNARGEMVFGMDNFGRSFRVARRAPKAAALREVASFPGSIKNKSIAVAPDGSMAVALDGDKYEIVRLDVSGKPIAPITRDIQRPRRTSVEESEYRQRLGRGLAMMSAEMKKQGKEGTVKPPVIAPEERGLKPHIATDGLRFDAANRLWVHTMRGDETRTVFDVFSPAGVLLGSVTIPQRITSYSLGGSWLVTAGENDEGVPVVTLWAVR